MRLIREVALAVFIVSAAILLGYFAADIATDWMVGHVARNRWVP